MIHCLKMYFHAYCISYCETRPNLKTFGQFENLVFVIMSTRENVRCIARASFDIKTLF